MRGSRNSTTRQVPRVLIVSTEMWLSSARQAMVLHSMSCEVVLLAPKKHPALVTGALSGFYRHDPFRPVPCLRRTLLRVRPDIIIPADERTLIHLQELWESAEQSGTDENLCICGLLERSIGSRDALFAARSRMRVLQVAQEEDVPIPQTISVDRESEIGDAIAALSFPMVLKADMTSGGDGVHVVENETDAHKSWRKLHLPPNLLRAVRRGVLFKNWGHVRSWAKRETLAITAQRFVAGTERTSMAVCLRGELLASVCLEVSKTWQARGPSSVLRIVRDEGMERAMKLVARRLRISGLCGFDFVLPHATNQALLIEMNPRPTQTAHLALGPGRDLMAAFARGMLGLDVKDRPSMTTGDTVALFPQELIRDPNSELIENAYHDVPWESPSLVRRAMKPLPAAITKDPRWHYADAREAVNAGPPF